MKILLIIPIIIIMFLCSIFCYNVYESYNQTDCSFIKDSYKYSKSQLIEAMDTKYKYKIEVFEKLYKSDKPRSIENVSDSNSEIFMGRCPNHYILVYRYYNRSNKEELNITEYSNKEFDDFPIRVIFDNKVGW